MPFHLIVPKQQFVTNFGPINIILYKFQKRIIDYRNNAYAFNNFIDLIYVLNTFVSFYIQNTFRNQQDNIIYSLQHRRGKDLYFYFYFFPNEAI